MTPASGSCASRKVVTPVNQRIPAIASGSGRSKTCAGRSGEGRLQGLLDQHRDGINERLRLSTPGADFLDSQMAHPSSKSVPLHAVPIAQQIPRGGLPWKSVHDLLSRPVGGGMLRDVHIHDPSPFMGEDDQDEEDPEPHGRDRKEIEGHHVLHVILEECLPGGRGRPLSVGPMEGRYHTLVPDCRSRISVNVALTRPNGMSCRRISGSWRRGRGSLGRAVCLGLPAEPVSSPSLGAPARVIEGQTACALLVRVAPRSGRARAG
jgi:hypothetical protein